VAKKISVFRGEDNVEYLKNYLLEAVREVMCERASDSNCGGASPTDAAMRFEYAVIAAARSLGGGQTAPLVAKAADPDPIDPRTGKNKTAARLEKEKADADRVAAADTQAYSCAAGPWRQIPTKHGVIGELADEAIKKAVGTGWISKGDYAGASMAGVGKKSPKWGGPAIQPKTDVKFGSVNISIKLAGDVQAASAEAANTAPQLQFIVDEWLKENAASTVNDANAKAAREQIEKLMATVKKDMLEHAKKQLITHTRAANLLKDIEKYKKILKDPAAKKEDRAKAEKKLPRYQDAIDALLAQGIIDSTGKVVIGKFDYKNWQKEHGNNIRDQLQKLFTQVAEEGADKGATSGPSLRDVLIDEILSGRRIFADAPGAIAHYMVSPDHCFSLVPTDGAGYNKTIATFAKIIKVDVRSKGGRSISKDGRLVDIGCKPSYRFDIRGKDIEGAFLEVQEAFAKQERALMKRQQQAGDTPEFARDDEPQEAKPEEESTAPEGLTEIGGDSEPDEGAVEQSIEKVFGALTDKLSSMMASALDADKTIESMMEEA
jgi:hypothetical protein